MNENELDEEILRKIETKIITLENENLKTKEKTNSEMIDVIKNLIEERVLCKSNQ